MNRRNFIKGTMLSGVLAACPAMARAADDLPFANQHEKTLYPKDWNGFGRDVLLAYREYL